MNLQTALSFTNVHHYIWVDIALLLTHPSTSFLTLPFLTFQPPVVVDVYLVTSGGLVEYQSPSAQQAAIAFLVAQGPSAIVNPEEAHARCVFAGLLPTDTVSRSSSSSSMVSIDSTN